jgi:N-acetylmuramoyl-L-alanine amidase
MKSTLKAFVFMILTFALCIPIQMIVKASTYTDMAIKNNVEVSKPWTVNFNKTLSATTVNAANIKVLGKDNSNIDINVSLMSDNKNVIVKPVKNYESNMSYTLIITKNVKSSDGKPLPQEVRMDFNTKDVSTKPSGLTVCIDPGQFFKEINGESGVMAKDINLQTALKLGDILISRGFNVIYTRDTDSVAYNQLNEDDVKATIAKNANADIFLSINTNSYSLNSSNGIETYYLSDVNNKNKLLAGSIQSELIKATEASDRGIKIGTSEILKKTSCPSVVVDLGFISNPIEETLLTDVGYQNNEAKAIANGLMNYAGLANTDTNYDSIFQITTVEDTMVNLNVGGVYTFPKTVIATMSNNSKKAVAVEWLQDSVTQNEVGTYTYTGVIKNYDKKVNVIINVTVPTVKKYKVVLDPGHGGIDPGVVGAMGTKEKTVVLAISLKVGNILVKNGVDVVYTREVDKTQSLQAKCDVSNNAKPDYFVSIHANGFSVPTASGIETYYSSGNVAGQKLAQAVQTELIKATGRIDRKIKTAGYYVLNNTDATAILVETSFVSNPTEEKLLITAAYQTKLAQAISTGILKSLGITKIVF